MEQIKIRKGQHVLLTLASNDPPRTVPLAPNSQYSKNEFAYPVLFEGRECELLASETLSGKLFDFKSGDELFIELKLLDDGKQIWIVKHKGHRDVAPPSPPSVPAAPQPSYETVQLEKEIMRQRENCERQNDIHTQTALKLSVEYLHHSPAIAPAPMDQIKATAKQFLALIEGGLRA